MASTPYLGTQYDVGDGHIMGQEVGGELINMTMIPATYHGRACACRRFNSGKCPR